MEVEFLEAEEKIGPSLGRVLGNISYLFHNYLDLNIFSRRDICDCYFLLHAGHGFQALQDLEGGIC